MTSLDAIVETAQTTAIVLLLSLQIYALSRPRPPGRKETSR